MRTLVTLSVLLSLSLVAFVATAAPPNPQLTAVGCAVVCPSGQVILVASGVNKNKSYAVSAVNLDTGDQDSASLMTPQPDGTFTLLVDEFSGNWEFTLLLLDHTANPMNPVKAVGAPLDIWFQ
jgi:hypothetical protein